jgi:alkanesulfonate monooxygenase SsuD/methylene tetrahydromethanopterin reductase-like flavin-dependent oxidoreductase (luciferase family)
MKFSVWPNMSHSPAEAFDIARWADSHGWYGVWYADHYMPNTDSERIDPGDAHECWAMLPAMAAVTERVRVGSLVAPTSVHHPAVLANRATTIDHISHGRMVLGIGAGWQINEHKAYGIELEPPGRRVTRFDEAIQIIRSLLDNQRTDFEGSVYTITDATADPKPVQPRLPVLVGTASPRMLAITVRHADEWNTWGAPALAAERRALLTAACEAAGRPTDSLHTSVQALVYLTDSPELIERTRSGPMAARAIAGPASDLVDAIGQYTELGFDEFIVHTLNLGSTPAERAERLEQIDAEVVSQLP